MMILLVILAVIVFAIAFYFKMKAIDEGFLSWFKFQIIGGPITIIIVFILLGLMIVVGGFTDNKPNEEELQTLYSYLSRKEEAMNNSIDEDIEAFLMGNESYPPITKYELWYNEEDNSVMLCYDLTFYYGIEELNESEKIKEEFDDEACEYFISVIHDEIKEECNLDLDVDIYFYSVDGENIIQKYDCKDGWYYN